MNRPAGSDKKIGVVLIGHGAPATDCPPEFVGELMRLEWRKNGHDHAAVAAKAAELDAKIRDWPRHAGNDPYKIGLEKVASALRPLLPTELFIIGYNEFCRPSIPEAIQTLIQQGARRIVAIPSMLTPGGLHSEIDVPRELEKIRSSHPDVSVEYVWPFDLKAVAQLLASHVDHVVQGKPV